MTLNIDLTTLHESLTKKISLYYLSSALPSERSAEEITRLPMLHSDSLSLLQAVYVQSARRVCSRLYAWISDFKISEGVITISFSDSMFTHFKDGELQTSDTTFSFISYAVVEACEMYTISEIYASANDELSSRFATRGEEITNSIVEMFGLFG